MAFLALKKKAFEKEEDGDAEESKDKPAPSLFAAKIKTLGEMTPKASESSDDMGSSLFSEHAGDMAEMMGVPAEKRSAFISALKSAIEACHEGGYDDEE